MGIPPSTDSQTFLAVHPVIDSRDVARTVDFFHRSLGFDQLFVDDENQPRYAGLGRDHEPRPTDWGTYEFGLYDPDGNALFFYRNRG